MQTNFNARNNNLSFNGKFWPNGTKQAIETTMEQDVKLLTDLAKKLKPKYVKPEATGIEEHHTFIAKTTLKTGTKIQMADDCIHLANKKGTTFLAIPRTFKLSDMISNPLIEYDAPESKPLKDAFDVCCKKMVEVLDAFLPGKK